ncbi:UNVERIFIED_CONTAM: hypothetical protein H355_012650 [Colinus virginianus]|nr:hypothetical protein H355_012650 [Colinus virginianus]
MLTVDFVIAPLRLRMLRSLQEKTFVLLKHMKKLKEEMEGVVKELAENNHILERQAIVFCFGAVSRSQLDSVHFVDQGCKQRDNSVI